MGEERNRSDLLYGKRTVQHLNVVVFRREFLIYYFFPRPKFRNEKDGVQDQTVAREMFQLRRVQDGYWHQEFYTEGTGCVLRHMLRGKVLDSLRQVCQGRCDGCKVYRLIDTAYNNTILRGHFAKTPLDGGSTTVRPMKNCLFTTHKKCVARRRLCTALCCPRLYNTPYT